MRQHKRKVLMHTLTVISVIFFIIAMFFLTDDMLTKSEKPSVFTISVVSDETHTLKQGAFYQVYEKYDEVVIDGQTTYDKNNLTYEFRFGYNRD